MIAPVSSYHATWLQCQFSSHFFATRSHHYLLLEWWDLTLSATYRHRQGRKYHMIQFLTDIATCERGKDHQDSIANATISDFPPVIGYARQVGHCEVARGVICQRLLNYCRGVRSGLSRRWWLLCCLATQRIPWDHNSFCSDDSPQQVRTIDNCLAR